MSLGPAVPDTNDIFTLVDGLPPRSRILLVDDNNVVRKSLCQVLERNNFEVVTAHDVLSALRLITTATFDALITDLHMPNPGDGLTVVSAMRHAHPKTITMIYSGYPEMSLATEALLAQADEVLVKPMGVKALVEAIQQRLQRGAGCLPRILSVADIIERETSSTITDWLVHVQAEPKLLAVFLAPPVRGAHLPRLFSDLVFRLRNPLPLGTHALSSTSATAHGLIRREQGYTAAMVVEESRMLQVSIFQTLQNNLQSVDLSILLVGVMAIADEVDSQLAQQMTSYTAQADAHSVA